MDAAKPLKGYHVLVTRGKEQAENLIQTITENGGISHSVPLIEFVLPQDIGKNKNHLDHLEDYNWLIFTSQNGVKFFFTILQQVKQPKEMPKIAVIGSKTKEALASWGYSPDFMPDEFVAEAFVSQFVQLLDHNDKVLIVKGSLARSVICNEINRFGADCQEIIVYETVFPEASESLLAKLLRTGKMDIVTFTSSSTVNHFMKAVKKHGLLKEAGETIIVCIGPIAKKTAEKHGLIVQVCPDEEYTSEAMIDTLIQYLDVKNQEEER